MILLYEPEDGPGEVYDLDALSAIEAAAIERVTGLDWDEVETELKAQKPTPLRAALWVWRKRGEPTLKFSDFDVPGWRKRLKVRLTTEEIADHVADVVRQVPDPDHPDRLHVLHLLRKVELTAGDVDAALADDGPKDPAAASEPSVSATAGTSPTS